MVDLEKYNNQHIEYFEAEQIPPICNNCNNDCYNCDFAGLRWKLTRKVELVLMRKAKAKAVKRLLKEIERIDAEIEGLIDG